MSSDRIVGDLAKRSLKPAGFRTGKKIDLFTTDLGVQELYPMKRRAIAMIATLGVLLTFATSLRSAAGPADGRWTLMTYNILHSLNPLPPANWSSRRPLVWQVIRRHQPDVLALQEVLRSQLEDFAKEFGATYAWVGLGHNGGLDGEILPVCWRRDRFELVAREFFWFSPTPGTEGSKGWGGRFPRVATRVRLREKTAGRELVVVNIHWEADNELMEARRESARLLLERTARLPADLPVFVVGDFNVIPTDGAHLNRPFIII